jgi:putative transposase
VKRQAAEVFVNEHQLSIQRACRILGLSRTAYYQVPRDAAARDAAVISVLNEIVARRPRWGFWKCYDRMRLDGHPWNHKRVHRVYCALRLNLPRRTKRRVPMRDPLPLDAPDALNVVWSLDFVHDALYDGRRFRTLNVLDDGNREGSVSRWRLRSPASGRSASWSSSPSCTASPMRCAWTTAAN